MYRKYYLVEVVLLLLLSHGGWNGPSVTLLSCTSESSKLVRDVVQQRFLSVVERYRVPLPLECPLHPKRDMFWWVRTELESTRGEGEEGWHCPVCGRRFGCENTFVTHWDVTHSRTLLGMAGETVCLDDYCDVFRCDVLRRKMLRTRMEEEENELRKRSPASQTISIFLQRDADDEDDEIKEKKMNCDAETMTQVHSKCRTLIRQCTLGMVANLSSQDFQDIEEDLDQSICSFLTCDRYWDDFEPHVHRVPVLVFAFFGLLVISLFCFCYYGVWLLLEKSTTISSQVCCSCQKASSIDGYYRLKRQKNRHKQNSTEFITKPNSLEYSTSKIYPEYATRKKSPEYTNKKYAPEIADDTNPPFPNMKQKSIEYNSRENSPEYDSRQNSPEHDSRQNSPEYESRQNSPEYDSRKESPEFYSRIYYNSKKNSHEYNSKQISSEYKSRQNSHEYDSRRNSPEYYYSRQNSPEYNSRHNSPDYISRQNSPECYSKRIYSDEFPRESSPEYHSIEHNSHSNSPEYDFKKNSSDFKLKQNSSPMDNSSEYKHKSLDIHHRKKTGVVYSQSSNTLQLPTTKKSH